MLRQTYSYRATKLAGIVDCTLLFPDPEKGERATKDRCGEYDETILNATAKKLFMSTVGAFKDCVDSGRSNGNRVVRVGAACRSGRRRSVAFARCMAHVYSKLGFSTRTFHYSKKNWTMRCKRTRKRCSVYHPTSIKTEALKKAWRVWRCVAAEEVAPARGYVPGKR